MRRTAGLADAAQLLDGVFAGGAEAEEDLRKPLARDSALFVGERFGKPFDDGRSDEMAQLLQLLDGRYRRPTEDG